MVKNIRNKVTLAQDTSIDDAIDAHEALTDPHTGYVKESDSNYVDLTDTGNTTLHTHDIYALDTDLTTHAGAADPHTVYVLEGATPGGELGGTYASPTVDATHSGSSHSTMMRKIAGDITAAGTAGSDNTAQTIVTVTIPANTMTQLGDELLLHAHWAGTTGSNITGTLKLGPAGSEVSIVATTDSGGTTMQHNEVTLYYVDNTHAHIVEETVAAFTAINVAGFTWDASQALIITQDAAANNHIVVYSVTARLVPKQA